MAISTSLSLHDAFNGPVSEFPSRITLEISRKKAKAETLTPRGLLGLRAPGAPTNRAGQRLLSAVPGADWEFAPLPIGHAPFRIPGARLLAFSRSHKLALVIPACQSSADGLTRNPTAVRPTARSTGEGPMSAVRSIIGVTTTRPSRALPVGLPALLLMSP